MKKNTVVNVVLLIAVIVFLNLVSNYLYFRLDLTEDKRYTLGNATKDILKDIEEPVTIKAYFSENLPPQVSKIKKDFEEYLIEYGRLSNGNVVFEFINPNKDEESENEARRQGISPLMINVREKDQTKQQRAYLTEAYLPSKFFPLSNFSFFRTVLYSPRFEFTIKGGLN